VVNASLLSGTFPESLKTTVVKLLLKKSNLDNTILSKYRPNSNIPFIGKMVKKMVFNNLKLKWILEQLLIWFPTASYALWTQ